jgi:hypothetical protein
VLRSKGDAIRFESILDDLLGPERDLGVFERFTPSAEPLDDSAEQALEQRVRRLEFDLLNALVVVKAELALSANTRNFDVLLTLRPGGEPWTDLEVRLAPFNSDQTTLILAPQGETEFSFENINESNLSRFLRFEILHDGELQRAFLVKIDIAGMPPSRVSKIIKGIICDRDKFFEYLRFLLADGFDKEAGDTGKHGGSNPEAADGAAGIWDVTSPIFEQLLVTAARRPGRLKEIDGIIRQLLDEDDQDKKGIVPEEFLTLWEAFRAMLPPTTEASA